MELNPSFLPHKGDPAYRAREMVTHLQKSDLYREYQEAFEDTTGLPLEMRPAGSFQAALQNSQNTNPFCSLMASRNKTCAACLMLQQQVEENA
ncbi:MAG: hypothetical protein WD941_04055, partial [Opitutus sp.]